MRHTRRLAKVLSLCLAIFCVAAVPMKAADKKLSEEQKEALKGADWAAVYNLMSQHAWYHASFKNDVELEKFWVKKTPNPIWAQNSQQWVGWDAIKKSYGLPTAASERNGAFQFHTVSTPVIEIAADRKTAKGVFYTAGMIGRSPKNGTPNGQWMWERYGMECVREDGVWKIWHLHVYTDFGVDIGENLGHNTPPTGGGAPPNAAQGGAQPGGAQPQQKAEKFGQETQNNANAEAIRASANAQSDGYPEFGPDSAAILMPRPPDPYTTYSETWHYVDLDERAKATEYTNSNKP